MLVRSSASQPAFAHTPVQPTLIEDLRNPLRPRRWEKGRLLGKGGFARVYEARDLLTGEIQAVKVVELASIVKAKARAKLASEIAIHRSLDSPYVVKFISHFEDATNVYIFLELCPNESLNELLRVKKRLAESECAVHVYHLVQGLLYLKRQRVIHRDLKLGNLFLDKHNKVRLGDFGLAAKLDFDFQKRLTVCGTPNYIAPEILDLHAAGPAGPVGSSRGGHSYPVDVWSLAVIMFTLLTGRPPFEDVDIKHTYQRIRDNRYAFPDHLALSSQVKSLIGSMLRSNPADRPSIEDIARHPWFAINGITVQPVHGPSAYGGLRSPAEVEGASLRRSMQGLPTHARHEPRPQVNSSQRLLGSASMNFLPGSFAPRTGLTPPPPVTRLSAAGVGWVVSRWLDYSTKYGMGVVLTNRKGEGRKILAVYFNDSTKMYADWENFQSATYLVRTRGSGEQKYVLRITDDPMAGVGGQGGGLLGQEGDLKKKMILIKNFRAYLMSETAKEGTERGKSVLAKFPTSGGSEEEEVHLRKYFRTRQAVVFVLSNKTQHVVFVDGSEDEVAIRPGFEASVVMPKVSAGVRNFRLSDELRDERVKRRLDQAVAIINGLGIHQPHGG